MLSVVVLPHPEGPTRTANSPSGMSRLTPSTARLAPNALVSPASRIPAIAPLLSQEAEAEALHQVLLDQEAQRDHRQRSEEHTSVLQSPDHLVCRLLLEKKKNTT